MAPLTTTNINTKLLPLLLFTIISPTLAGPDPCGPTTQPPTYTWNSCTDAVNRSSPNAPGPYAIYWDSDPQFVFTQNCTSTDQIMIEPWPIEDFRNPAHPAPEVDVLCAGMTSQNITNSWVFARYIDKNAQAGEVGLYIPGATAGSGSGAEAGAGVAPMLSYEQCQRNLFKVMATVGTRYTNRASVNLVPGGFPMSTYGAYRPIGVFSTGQQVDAGYPSYLARTVPPSLTFNCTEEQIRFNRESLHSIPP